MGLLLQIVVFLIVAAALGFAVGWVVRGGALLAEQPSGEPDWRARLAQVTAERDRLRAELAAAGEGRAAAGRRGTTDQAEQARIDRLEGELASVRQAHQTEVRRLQARIAELEASALTTADKTAGAPSGGVRATAGGPGTAPPALARPEGEADDLQQISGIGPGIERTLHALGIFHFRQIAALTPENVTWINQRLRFRGRVEREDWIGQANRLAAGSQPLQ